MSAQHKYEKVKLCKNCKHARRDWLLGYSFAKCGAITDLVAGKPKWLCDTERDPKFDGSSVCGSKGLLWEQKQSAWSRARVLFLRVSGQENHFNNQVEEE